MTTTKDIRERFIAAAGDLTQALGYGRNIGQIYAHIYLSPTPQSLDDLTVSLEISKGSASMSVRQLEQWSALQRIWVKGSRKDYYEASEEFGKIMRKAMIDMVGRASESADNLLEESRDWLSRKQVHGPTTPDLDFMNDRIKKLQVFRDRAHGLWTSPLIRVLFK